MKFLNREGGNEELIQFSTTTDYVLLSLLQYAKNGYGCDLTGEGFPRLVEFYERFGKRESAKVEGGYPEEMLRRSLVWADALVMATVVAVAFRSKV